MTISSGFLYLFLVFQVRALTTKADNDLGLNCGHWLMSSDLLGITTESEQTRSQKGIRAWDKKYQSGNCQVMNSWEDCHESVSCQVSHEWHQEWVQAVKRDARWSQDSGCQHAKSDIGQVLVRLLSGNLGALDVICKT